MTGDESMQQIDLNEASFADLLKLPGIREKLARRIQACRPFRQVEHLRGVEGIGDGKFARLRPLIRAKPSRAARAEG
jgi:competence protein ComEA